MNLVTRLTGDIKNIASKYCSDKNLIANIALEVPRNDLFGDLSTNMAMVLAPSIKKSPHKIAMELKEDFMKLPDVAYVETAGAGFINITIKASAWQEEIKNILSSDDYFNIKLSGAQKINIEYVSANPTGPMHVGHGRCAVFGDVLANLLAKYGHKVTKEYYINDTGRQIDDLVASLKIRYSEIINNKTIPIPEGLYPGEYLIDAAKQLVDQQGRDILTLAEDKQTEIFKKFVLSSMMSMIKDDLKKLRVYHDVFYSEQTLHDQELITKVVEDLKKQDLVYYGTLPAPKGHKESNWEEREQLLFRATKFGDDQDRPLQKSDGTWSYFAGDLAYTKDKIDRGFEKLIFVLGADHGGYVKRIKAITRALSNGAVECEVKICQMVNFVAKGKAIKMSKRNGTFCSIAEVMESVDADILRFIMLTRRGDVVIDFNLEDVTQYSKENPVFYVQYAHVRTNSIFNACEENFPAALEKFNNKEYDLSLLECEEEIKIIKTLSLWQKNLESAAMRSEPHKIVFYLIDLASEFHALWNMSINGLNYRFIVQDNLELTAARIALASAVQKIIAKNLSIIGVKPIDKM